MLIPIAFTLFLLTDTNINGQTSVAYGQLVYSLRDATLSAGLNGTSIALPQRNYNGITWCYDFTVDPSAVSINLQYSNDNSSWTTASNLTVTTGACTTIHTSARFARCNLTSHTGGTELDCNLNVLPFGFPPSNVTLAGNISFTTHNAYDIGSASISAKNIYAGTLIRSGSTIQFGAQTTFLNGGDGILAILNGAQTDFNRLQLGGVTSSFPAIKRSAAGIELRLGDDSARTSLTGSAINATGTVMNASSTFAALGTPANGTFQYCTDCTFANPCASGGTGAIAKRLNGAWRCD